MSAPWRDRDRLAPLLAAWRDDAVARPLYRTVTGPGWVSLSLTGDDRSALFLGALPGAVLAFPFTAPLPRSLHNDLSPTRRDPLHDLLRDATLIEVGLLRDDLVIELRLETAAGTRRLRHQLFGQRGGIVVLDDHGRMLWTTHPSPHPSLVDHTSDLAPTVDPAGDLSVWSSEGLDRLTTQRTTALGDRLQRAVARRLTTGRRLVANLATDLERADGGEERRRDAEALAAYLHTVRRGDDTITVDDPRDGLPRTIALDPARTPSANLEHLFKLARKAQRGREVIAERLTAARAELAVTVTGEAELERLLANNDDPVDRLDELHTYAASHAELVAGRKGRARRSGRAPDEPARPFRRYRIDDRWDVWVGRSSKENDELTHRASHPRDLWLHAQGVGGSHVILRTDGRPETVPRPVLEKAAALAALHSKARHSGLVPVIWTERRYVRRPRKALPGTAVCLREENLFVEPGMAPGVEPA